MQEFIVKSLGCNQYQQKEKLKNMPIWKKKGHQFKNSHVICIKYVHGLF